MLFELLENAGFLKRAAINTGRIASAKRSDLVSIAEQSAELTSTSSVSNPDSVFSHTASLSLSGGPTPCASAGCRIRRARELVQFAAFYSDRVFVNNNLFTSSGRFQNVPIDEARSAFHDELEIILIFRPLIESGLVVPVTPTTTLCYHCLGKSALPEVDRKRFDSSLRRFAKRFETETEATLECWEDGSVGLNIEGSDELVEHGFSHQDWGRITKLAKDHPQLVTQLKSSQAVPLSRGQRKKFEVDAGMAHDLFNDIGFEMAMSQCLKTSIVTSRQVHVEILNDFVKDLELNRRNAFIQEHLTCIVPFLNDVSPRDLLVLRKGEADAFVSFRQAFARAVDEHIKAKPGYLSKQDAAAVFKEVIEPELARLNRRVTSASKSVFRKSGAGMLGWAAAISAGFYFGFIQSSLLAAAKAFGLTKIAADLVGTSAQDTIRNESMYFLWKVRHRAQRS